LISIVIPSRGEIFLRKTIEDVLEKSVTEIEVFPVLDGYEPPENEIVEDSRVKYVRLAKSYHTQKRHGINKVINELAKGNYVMSLDAHCMLAMGWDEILLKDLAENEVTLPRRHRLDAINWCLQSQSDSRPPIDYEYIMWPLKFDPIGFHGFKWDDRTLARWDIKIDETMEIQGSFWLMYKTWFQKCGFMRTEGYTGWGQEGEEITMTTYKNGGRVLTNKNTYFSHLHKGKEFGRMYFLPKKDTRASLDYCYKYWTSNENRNFFVKFIEKFMPIPGWPQDFEEQIYSKGAN
jgi:hypothetical protein